MSHTQYELRTLSVASHNLDLVDARHLLHLPELNVVEHERPHIIAETIGVELGRLERKP